jgi:hypothetical protein
MLTDRILALTRSLPIFARLPLATTAAHRDVFSTRRIALQAEPKLVQPWDGVAVRIKTSI